MRYQRAKILCLLLFALLLSDTAGGKAGQIHVPVLLWSRGTGDMAKGVPNDSNQSLMVTPHVLLVASRRAYGIAAFDHRTGHALWRKVAFVKATDYHGILDYEQWRPVGTASGPAGKEIAILWHLHSKATPDTSDPILLHFQIRHDLEAVDARTGQRLWQEDLPATADALLPDLRACTKIPYERPDLSHSARRAVVRRTTRRFVHGPEKMAGANPLQPDLTPAGVYGGVLLLASVSQNPHVEFRDAVTGARLDPTSTPGREALQQAAARQGAAILPISLPGHPSLLDLQTDRLTPLALYATAPESRVPQGIQVYRMEGRIVAYVDTDDGGVGHSTWPKYLWGGDTSGHKLWQFPARITYRDRYQLEAAASSQLVRALPGGGGIILTEDMRGTLYGIEAGTGKLLWRRRLPDMLIDMAALEGGALVLTRPLNPSGRQAEGDWLTFVSARSGRALRLGRVPPSNTLLVSGRQLFLLDEQGTLRTYALGRASAMANHKETLRRAASPGDPASGRYQRPPSPASSRK